MKKQIINVGATILMSMMLWSCSDETAKDPQPTPPIEGIPTEVSLVVKTNTKNGSTRAGEVHPSEGEEATIVGKKVKLYVYSVDGKLEYENDNVQLDAQNSVVIRLKTGEKYFYVSANTGNSDNNDAATTIGKATTPAGYEQQTLSIAFGASGDVPDLTTSNFVLGTLWREKQTITTDMTDPIELNIGRIVAKVKLTKVDKGTNYSVMLGQFEEPQYTIGAVPTICYWVGRYNHSDWTLLPPPGDTNGLYGAVESAVHSTSHLDGGVQNPIFHNYPSTSFTDVTPMSTPMGNAFYIVENTTAEDALFQQYYGNTTYIRLKTVYVPDPEEVFDAGLKSNNQALTDNTFWTVISNEVRYITNAVPEPGIGDVGTEIKKYEKGVNYHRFAIKDAAQTNVEKRYSVYRNHYYEISVTGIRDLGEPTDIVDPTEPIPNEEDVTTSVEVIDWSKITQIENI